MQAEVPVEIRMFAWATPKPGMALEQLEAHLRSTGNQVLEIDKTNNRIKVADVTEKL